LPDPQAAFSRSLLRAVFSVKSSREASGTDPEMAAVRVVALTIA
jgi:hypothetical protein